jgi:hypothetical protein
MVPYEGKPAPVALRGRSLGDMVAVGEWPALGVPMFIRRRRRQIGELGALSGPARMGNDAVDASRASDIVGACEGGLRGGSGVGGGLTGRERGGLLCERYNGGGLWSQVSGGRPKQLLGAHYVTGS